MPVRYLFVCAAAALLAAASPSDAQVTRVSVATGCTQGDAASGPGVLSADGRFVAFASDATNLVRGVADSPVPDVFVADLRERTVTRASQAPDGDLGNLDSGRNSVAVSGDGKSLAYGSYASNLVEGDQFDLEEAFVWHR